MSKLIVANWKMNPNSREEAERLLKLEQKPGVIICPPFIYLGEAKGAQDAHWEKQGAYTGEISAPMLKNLGVEYVIVGHSERKEQDDIVNQKAKACLRAGLVPIICIEKEKQIINRLKDLRGEFIIAYEPAEEDQPMDPDKALEMAIIIRKKIGLKTRVLYGGDVDENNCADYKLDGLLIGQASLSPKKFNKICQRVLP